MQIIENDTVVLISIPRFCVAKEDAEEFLRLATRFWNDVQITMVEECGSERLEYDNRYVDGEFIPTITQINSYSNCLSKSIDVQEINKYILLEPEEKYVDKIDVKKLWCPEKCSEDINEDTY